MTASCSGLLSIQPIQTVLQPSGFGPRLISGFGLDNRGGPGDQSSRSPPSPPPARLRLRLGCQRPTDWLRSLLRRHGGRRPPALPPRRRPPPRWRGGGPPPPPPALRLRGEGAGRFLSLLRSRKHTRGERRRRAFCCGTKETGRGECLCERRRGDLVIGGGDRIGDAGGPGDRGRLLRHLRPPPPSASSAQRCRWRLRGL
mmetsp:Transcript_125918/g.251243  ORF Transcript_125918/g.251243 Transcript_125918/m.251243 type:complete len:200 (-) Transcript_125918:227-826(-)